MSGSRSRFIPSFTKTLVIAALLGLQGIALAGIPPFVKGEIVVKGDPSEFAGYEIIKHLPLTGLTVLRVSPGREMAEVNKLRLKHRKASLNLIAHKSTDPLYSYQWNFPAVQAEAAWDQSSGSGIVVAVLDTGLAPNGPDGISCVLPGIDIAYGDNDPSDGDGHGTHVSGTIAQRTDNNKGVAGLAHGACILPVKVLNDRGSGSDADIAEGIAWAINQGARVINMSLGYPAQYRLDDFAGYPSYNALNTAPDSVAIAVAAGNDGYAASVSYPASHPNTIAVGATGYDDTVAPYSNQGTNLDLVAPGGNLTQDLNHDGYGDGILQETIVRRKWGYYFFQGTSMASPHVAAAAAMLLSKDASLDRAGVLSALSTTAKDLGVAGLDPVYGHGLIQVADALAAVEGSVVEPPSIPAVPSSTTATNNKDGSATIGWIDESDNEDGFLIQRQEVDVSTGIGGPWSLIASVGADTTSYRDAPGAGTYAYRVSAYNSGGQSGWSEEVLVTITKEKVFNPNKPPKK